MVGDLHWPWNANICYFQDDPRKLQPRDFLVPVNFQMLGCEPSLDSRVNWKPATPLFVRCICWNTEMWWIPTVMIQCCSMYSTSGPNVTYTNQALSTSLYTLLSRFLISIAFWPCTWDWDCISKIGCSLLIPSQMVSERFSILQSSACDKKSLKNIAWKIWEIFLDAIEIVMWMLTGV